MYWLNHLWFFASIPAYCTFSKWTQSNHCNAQRLNIPLSRWKSTQPWIRLEGKVMQGTDSRKAFSSMATEVTQTNAGVIFAQSTNWFTDSNVSKESASTQKITILGHPSHLFDWVKYYVFLVFFLLAWPVHFYCILQLQCFNVWNVSIWPRLDHCPVTG